MLLFFATYILFFILFGTLIFILDRTVEDNQMELNYWEGILFIGYTVSTVGYGTEFPKSGSAALAPLLAVLCGMLIHSFWVALLVCRLGDPRTVTHTVLFSNRAVVYDQPISLKGPQMFECRFVSLRTESWVEAHINMYYISWRSGSPEFIQLEMVNSGVPPLMSLPWSVKHEITPESPLYGLSIEQIATERGEVVVQVDGYCPFSGNGMTKRFSYIACEIFQGHVLYDVLSVDSNCQFVVCLDDFHRTKLQNNTIGDNS